MRLEKELYSKDEDVKEKEKQIKNMEESHQEETADLEAKLREVQTSMQEMEETWKIAKRTEAKKLVSSITKLLLSNFPEDQVIPGEVLSAIRHVQEVAGAELQERIRSSMLAVYRRLEERASQEAGKETKEAGKEAKETLKEAED